MEQAIERVAAAGAEAARPGVAAAGSRSLLSPRVLREIAAEAVTGLYHHRVRAALSLLGIAWGIVSVIVLLAYGSGFHSALAYGFAGAFTEGTSVVWPGQTSMQAGGERAGRRVRLTIEDVEAVRQIPLVRAASPEFVRRFPVAHGSQLGDYNVRGVSAEYGAIRVLRPEEGEGRFLNAEDVAQRRRVAFIGSEVRRKLFGSAPAVGQDIRIGGLSFEVVGVLYDKVSFMNYFSPDRSCVFIPHTAMGQLTDTRYLSVMVVQAVSSAVHEQALSEVRHTLGTRHRYNPADERAVTTFGSLEANRMLGGITGGLRVVLVFIGVLTLAIGGVGVMNIMFVSVTERTREIGLRKALGARRREILLQFLLEGLATTAAGGAIGIALSWLLVRLLTPQPFLADLVDDVSGNTNIHLALSFELVLTAAGILMLVGLVSGLLPALRASRMDPVEALRYE